MITYGHEKFIKEAIEGVLMQECDFEVELIIANDCSPDNTDAVVKEILKKHPKANMIKYTKHEFNLGMMPNFIWALEQCKGKYIALCEGDDFWTDPFKLQKQFDFLERDMKYSMVFHLANCVGSNNEIISVHGPKFPKKDFSIEDAILHSANLVPTNSMFFCSNYINRIPTWVKKAPVGDVPLILILALNGNLGFINEKMSVYRIMTEFSWSKDIKTKKIKRIRHYNEVKNMWKSFDQWSLFKYSKFIKKKLIINSLVFIFNEVKIKFSFFPRF